MNHANDRYWSLDAQIEALKAKSKKDRLRQDTYNGKPTKHALRLARLQMEQRQFDLARCQPSAMPQSLRKLFSGQRLNRDNPE